MTILAETQQAATGGGSAWFLPVMLLAMVLLLWLPMRRQKKAQAEMKTKQASMGPGTQVMTSFGLFGTLQEMDRENNKAVLEIAPGQLVTVHSQTVTTVVDETPEADAADQDAAQLPADGSTAAHAEQDTAPTHATAVDHDTPLDEAPSHGTVTDGSASALDGAEHPEPGNGTDPRGRGENGNPTI
ncbi:preprotein translocase subunit YajC [Kocuria sp. KSNUG]|uniref:preprotein translocase subunit YajC n=1 Tax=Kocuria sp. KSNUG TaxID=3136676 RepID=UPI003C2DD0A0